MLTEELWSSKLRQEVTEHKASVLRFNQEWNLRQPPTQVSHYTSVTTIRAILENNRLRLYDIRTMDDQEEFLHPLRIVRESIQPYWCRLPRRISHFFEKGNPIQPGIYWDAFLSCSCGADETPAMWKAYGAAERALQFNIVPLPYVQNLRTLPFIPWFTTKCGSGVS